MLRSTRTRKAAFVASAALVITALGQVPAQAASDPSPAKSAATWMVGNLNEDGLLTTTPWGESTPKADLGLTLELGSSLALLGGHSETVAAIHAALEASGDTYTANGTKASATAKALAFTSDAGTDATVAGRNLLTAIESMVVTSGPSAGRVHDAPSTYYSTWTQAWAAKSLKTRSSAKADAAVDYLLKQQCPAGFFRDALPGDLSADQSCGAAEDQPAPDTTALALIQLVPLAQESTALDAALDKAANWLVGLQQDDGAFADPWLGPNSNSTGLVGHALALAGKDDAARDAAIWLRRHQFAGECAPAVANETGALAHSDTALADALSNGIAEPVDREQWIYVGIQAIPGLASAPANGAEYDIVTPKFAQAGTTVTVTVRGLAAGERACVTGLGASRPLVGTGAKLTVSARVQVGTVSPTLRTATELVQRAGGTRVLGKKKLKVKAAKKAKAGSKKKVTVRGLASGEKVTIKVRGKKVAQGKANAKGIFAKKVPVLKKRGVAKVVVTGQFKTRKGLTTIRVR